MGITLRPQWDQRFSYDESIKILTDLAWAHVSEAGRFTDSLANCLRSRDWAGLCDFKLDYRYDDDPLHLINARQVLAFFQKFEPLKIGVDKEAVAWGKFQDAEVACKLTNETFRLCALGRFNFSPDVSAVLHGAQRKIARILGPLPRLEDLQFGFGPGANTSVKASASSPRHKLGARLECSSELLQTASAILGEAPAWVENHAHAETSDSWFVDVVVTPGRLQFVPKNAKTYRSIVVEPILNSFAQKGIGSWLKERLAFAGIDTTDQSRNQKLAFQGSRSDSLATVDLSSASDTISKELVAHLLPLDWFTFLAQFRTGKVEYRGEIVTLEKFSSMGNGFTFELETLIFYALAYSACSYLNLPTGWTTSYGDDIIVPSEAYPLLERVLTSCGFSVNMEKSYASGPFRESCGTDYWRGIDIRPFYQKDMVSGESLFCLHNYYMREFNFPRARAVLARIHPSIRLFGPDGYGDGHLIGDWSHHSRHKTRYGWEGRRFDTFIKKPKRNFRMVPGDWVAPVYSSYVSGDSFRSFTDIKDPSDHYVVRGSRGYKRISIYTLRLGVFS